MKYRTGDRIRIDATTDSRLAARTNGQYGTILPTSPFHNSADYLIKLDGNPFALGYHEMDLMPA